MNKYPKDLIISAVFGAVMSAVLLFMFLTPTRQETFIEANRVEHSIWLREALNEFPFNEEYGEDLHQVCVFPAVETTLASLLAMHDLKFISVLHGSREELEQEKLGGIFRVLMIDKNGYAEIWKFDERRFRVSFDDQSRAFGCKGASSIYYRADKDANDIFVLKVKPMEDK